MMGKKLKNLAKKWELLNCLLFSCVHSFSYVFTCVLHIFHIFKTHCFHSFFQAHFQNAFLSHVFTFLPKKNVKKCEEQHLKIQLGRWNSDFVSSGLIFWGSSFAAVTLLPAQLLQVENRRGAVQMDRKWIVQIADLFNLSIAKQ